jgi:hypothetical protein
LNFNFQNPEYQTVAVFCINAVPTFFSSITGCEDYRYYFSSLQSYDIDLAGLAETNTCWPHPHLQQDLCHCLRRFYPQQKITFASPDPGIDRCAPSESFQAGGSFTLARGISASRVQGTPLRDETGLGRWSGLQFTGQSNEQFCILTAYRVCNGSAARSPIGSSYLREYEYFRSIGHQSPQPRRLFLTHLKEFINSLQQDGSAILLMLDANEDLSDRGPLREFIVSCGLNDLHSRSPAPSTYIGSATRRIDFMFGCERVLRSLTQSGTLLYTDGPQSDHRGLFVDLQMDHVFESSLQSPMQPLAHRTLTVGNPELVSQYHTK